MKELMQQYAQYNHWANQRIAEAVLGLSTEQQQQEIPSSFPGIYKTLFHLWSVDVVWLQRLHEGQVLIQEDPFKNSMAGLTEALLEKNLEWISWLDGQDENKLKEDFSYKNLKGQSFREPLYQILLHVFNHGSYHRGQIVTLFHHLGVEKIPATDFILWSRALKSA